MLRTGKEHIERLRDGRVVYIGRERVDDVTTHPAFGNAARTVAAIYDMKADPANREIMSFTEAGRRLLGRLCALEATLGGMIHGQIEGWEHWPDGFATFNRGYM